MLNATVGMGPPPGEVLLKWLSDDTPVIVGLPPQPGGDVGHAVVITAVIYERTADSIAVRSIMVRDPDPTYAADQGKRQLGADEYSGIETYYLVTEVPE
jgi:hypothetical protein